MRVFQVGNIYPAHLEHLKPRLAGWGTEVDTNTVLLNDVPQAQLLSLCLSNDPNGRLCFPQYEEGLRHWASHKGLPADTMPEDILLAQIEDHRSEVFYSINATHHSERFIRRMPACVRLKIGWLGSRIVGRTLPLFDAIVSNFPTLNARHRAQGLNVHYLTPSYEPQTDRFIETVSERPIDIFFAGTYSRHHTKRARLIEAFSNLASDRETDVRLHLLNSRYTFLSERTPLGWVEPFRALRRPHSVRRIARPPLFGADMFKQLCSTKVVINMAIDIAGRDRGNMRCFEAMSAGAMMISDGGDYPEGFVSGQTHLTYQTIEEAITLIETSIGDPAASMEIGQRGASMLRNCYSKDQQWSDFVSLCYHLMGD